MPRRRPPNPESTRPSRRDRPGRRVGAGKPMPEPRTPKIRSRGRNTGPVSSAPAALPQDRTRRHARQAPRIGIVVSRYNASITDHLLEGALGEFERAGGSRADVVIVIAPGAYELIALGHALAKSKRVDGIVALGCIIKGETIHDRVLADAIAQAFAQVMIATSVPIALGVLNVNTIAQAQARAGGEKGNKGAEALSALLATLAAMHKIANPASSARSDHQQKYFGGTSGDRPDKASDKQDRNDRRDSTGDSESSGGSGNDSGRDHGDRGGGQ